MKSKKKNQMTEEGGEREEREKIFSFLSKRQSWSTRRELHMGTKILAFRQTPRGREFSYLCYFYPKGHLMAWDFLRGRERP